MHVLSMDKSRIEASIQQSSASSEGELVMASARTAALEQEKDSIQAELEALVAGRSSLEQDLAPVRQTMTGLQGQLDRAAQERAAVEAAAKEQQRLAAQTLLGRRSLVVMYVCSGSHYRDKFCRCRCNVVMKCQIMYILSSKCLGIPGPVFINDLINTS